MKKFILMVVMAMFTVQMANAADVYISQSSSAKAYHKDKNCRSLKRTTAQIAKVTESEAKKFGRKPCAFCYGKRWCQCRYAKMSCRHETLLGALQGTGISNME